MADDPIEVLRTEMVDALAVVAPQIAGLHELELVSLSPDLATEITAAAAGRQRRSDLITAVIQAIDALVAALNALSNDGFPTLPAVPILPSLFTELQAENAEIQVAVGLFTAKNIVTFDENAPTTDVPQPVPNQG